jgi:hypothetical protein
MPPIRVEPIVIPITISTSHSWLLTALVVLAVSLQLAIHRFRSRSTAMNMPYEKKSLLDVLREMTIRR